MQIKLKKNENKGHSMLYSFVEFQTYCSNLKPYFLSIIRFEVLCKIS